MKLKSSKRLFNILCLVVAICSCSFHSFAKSDTDIYVAAVKHEKRSKEDLELDKTRKPLDILPFTQVKPGDKVLELGAGGGYTTELMSWLVGSSGRVYTHFLYNQERLANNRLSNVTSLRQHSLNDHKTVLEENEVASLDAIIIFFVLHDIYLNNEMSKELLATLLSSLRPGGFLIVLDNAAQPDSGLAHTESLHRIGENFVKDEITKAGFVFDASINVLRNKQDDHSQPWGEFKGMQDRFAFRFKKPLEESD